MARGNEENRKDGVLRSALLALLVGGMLAIPVFSAVTAEDFEFVPVGPLDQTEVIDQGADSYNTTVGVKGENQKTEGDATEQTSVTLEFTTPPIEKHTKSIATVKRRIVNTCEGDVNFRIEITLPENYDVEDVSYIKIGDDELNLTDPNVWNATTRTITQEALLQPNDDVYITIMAWVSFEDIIVRLDLKVTGFDPGNGEEIGSQADEILLVIPATPGKMGDFLKEANATQLQTLVDNLIENGLLTDEVIDALITNATPEQLADLTEKLLDAGLFSTIAAALEGDTANCTAILAALFNEATPEKLAEIAQRLNETASPTTVRRLAAQVAGLINSTDLDEEEIENARAFLKALDVTGAEGGDALITAALIIAIVGIFVLAGLGAYYYRDLNRKINWLRKRLRD